MYTHFVNNLKLKRELKTEFKSLVFSYSYLKKNMKSARTTPEIPSDLFQFSQISLPFSFPHTQHQQRTPNEYSLNPSLRPLLILKKRGSSKPGFLTFFLSRSTIQSDRGFFYEYLKFSLKFCDFTARNHRCGA